MQFLPSQSDKQMLSWSRCRLYWPICNRSWSVRRKSCWGSQTKFTGWGRSRWKPKAKSRASTWKYKLSLQPLPKWNKLFWLLITNSTRPEPKNTNSNKNSPNHKNSCKSSSKIQSLWSKTPTHLINSQLLNNYCANCNNNWNTNKTQSGQKKTKSKKWPNSSTPKPLKSINSKTKSNSSINSSLTPPKSTNKNSTPKSPTTNSPSSTNKSKTHKELPTLSLSKKKPTKSSRLKYKSKKFTKNSETKKSKLTNSGKIFLMLTKCSLKGKPNTKPKSKIYKPKSTSTKRPKIHLPSMKTVSKNLRPKSPVSLPKKLSFWGSLTTYRNSLFQLKINIVLTAPANRWVTTRSEGQPQTTSYGRRGLR